MKETTFYVHVLVLKAGFQNPILGHNAPYGWVVNIAFGSGRDKPKICLHTCLLVEDVKVVHCCVVYNRLHEV
jgi:hypothetical protein